MPAEKGELPERQDWVQPELILEPESASSTGPGQELRGVARSESRAVGSGERAAEAKEKGVFFETTVEEQDWVEWSSSKVEKQRFLVRQEEFEEQM